MIDDVGTTPVILEAEADAEADCFPLDGVSHVDNASTIRTQSAELAREALARAEHEIRDLQAQEPSAADFADRSSDIVARAQREVSDLLAQGQIEHDDPAEPAALIRPEPGRWQQQRKAATLSDADTHVPPRTTDHFFATLRAAVLPSETGALRYRVSGHLTLATMLAFQYAVSRLPGVDSARVDPEPDDVAVLSMITNDPALVRRLLERMPGVHLQIDPA